MHFSQRTSTIFFRLLFVGMILGWTVFLSNHSPEEIVNALGTRNGYLIAFVTAFLGGLSLFIVVPYYLAVGTLAAGGLNPFLLGIIAGTGVMLGDTTSYLVGYHGAAIFPDRIKYSFDKFSMWIHSRPYWLISLILFLYGSFIPFPNDVLTVSLGLAQYPYIRMILPLGLGNIMFNTAVAFLASHGTMLFGT